MHNSLLSSNCLLLLTCRMLAVPIKFQFLHRNIKIVIWWCTEFDLALPTFHMGAELNSLNTWKLSGHSFSVNEASSRHIDKLVSHSKCLNTLLYGSLLVSTESWYLPHKSFQSFAEVAMEAAAETAKKINIMINKMRHSLSLVHEAIETVQPQRCNLISNHSYWWLTLIHTDVFLSGVFIST